MKQVIYRGRRTPTGETIVEVVSSDSVRLLPMRLDLRNHSPTGFEWGYNGSGPAQLALALCADASNDHLAQRIHQDVKDALIVNLNGETWFVSRNIVVAVIEGIEATTAVA